MPNLKMYSNINLKKSLPFHRNIGFFVVILIFGHFVVVIWIKVQTVPMVLSK